MKNIKYIAATFLLSGMLSAQNIDINAMPKPAPTPVINIAKPQIFQLKNGLTVMVVENHKLPRVTISLHNNLPPIYEGDITGVGNLMADQLDNGTTTISKDEFNKKLDFFGASLHFSSAGASANTLSKYYPQVLDLMAQAIINPNFTEEETAKGKERSLEQMKAVEKSADEIGNRVYFALTYGKNTAEGEFQTKESINKIKLDDIKNFHKKYFSPNTADLVIVGDVNVKDVKKLVTKSFNNWKKGDNIAFVKSTAQNVAKTEIDIVDIPNAVQSVINVGNITKLQMNDPLYFAGVLANSILGGGGEARLFMNLREKNAFTYGAYSTLSTNKYTPNFKASASVRNEVTDKAIVEFMNELRGISSIKQEELDLVKAKHKGSFIMSLEEPSTIARFALNKKIYNLPENFYANYLKSVDNVTIGDISKVVKENILPNQTRIFVAGKVSDIADNVEKLGYPVKYFDTEANQVEKPVAKKVAEGVTTQTIAEKYINNIGGKTAVESIKSLKYIASASVQGMTLEITDIKGQGGKHSLDMQMMGQSIQKIVFNGKDGYLAGQGQKMPLPEDVVNKMKEEATIFPELSFNNAELKGIETINGEDAYAIKKGSKTLLYSVKTGLKIGEITTESMNGKTVTYPTYFSDYRDVKGIKLPFKISQNLQGMDIIFEVKSYEMNKATDADFK